MSNILSVILLALLGLACQPAAKDDQLMYAFHQPDQTITLPEDLDEISGLSYYQEGMLAAVDDEEQHVFLIDVQKGEVVSRINMGEKRDYEAIEIINGRVYALESNGDFFVGNLQDDAEFEQFETALTREDDMEGLTYDPETQRLIMVKKATRKDSRIVLYEAKPDEGTFQVNTWLEIFLASQNADLQLTSFRPSGIALHPKTQLYYLISAADERLIILDPSGKILKSIPLPERIYAKPEGICFSPEGTLYISNENKGGKSDILIFHPKK